LVQRVVKKRRTYTGMGERVAVAVDDGHGENDVLRIRDLRLLLHLGRLLGLSSQDME